MELRSSGVLLTGSGGLGSNGTHPIRSHISGWRRQDRAGSTAKPAHFGLGGAASLLQLIVTSGKLHTGLVWIAFGALFTWAWLEVFQGVNYFRRALGLVVLIETIIAKVWMSGE